jgi:hypothetical protein
MYNLHYKIMYSEDKWRVKTAERCLCETAILIC